MIQLNMYFKYKLYRNYLKRKTFKLLLNKPENINNL